MIVYGFCFYKKPIFQQSDAFKTFQGRVNYCLSSVQESTHYRRRRTTEKTLFFVFTTSLYFFVLNFKTFDIRRLRFKHLRKRPSIEIKELDLKSRAFPTIVQRLQKHIY